VSYFHRDKNFKKEEKMKKFLIATAILSVATIVSAKGWGSYGYNHGVKAANAGYSAGVKSANAGYKAGVKSANAGYKAGINSAKRGDRAAHRSWR
jgi:hypothetical protein